jgi:hypothetical protein
MLTLGVYILMVNVTIYKAYMDPIWAMERKGQKDIFLG